MTYTHTHTQTVCERERETGAKWPKTSNIEIANEIETWLVTWLITHIEKSRGGSRCAAQGRQGLRRAGKCLNAARRNYR